MLDIAQLDELKAQGRISEADYEAQKRAIYKRAMRESEGNVQAKNGIIYILLAWFLGVTGIHNFYAGYWGRGLAQLVLSLTSWLFMFIPLMVVAVWVFFELLFVNKDAKGVYFKGSRRIITVLRIIAVVWLVLAFSYSNLIFSEQIVSVDY